MGNQTTIPKWFWAAAIIALLWNIMGVLSFYQNVFISDAALAKLPLEEQAQFAKYPLWTQIIFAIAVFGGLIGSIGLLLRKKWATSILAVSLIAIIVQMFHSLVIARATDYYGPNAVVLPLVIVAFAAALFWFSGLAQRKNWIQ